MPNLTVKGSNAMHQIIKYFTTDDKFSANDLSVRCGEKFVASTLNALTNHNLLIKHHAIRLSQKNRNSKEVAQKGRKISLNPVK